MVRMIENELKALLIPVNTGVIIQMPMANKVHLFSKIQEVLNYRDKKCYYKIRVKYPTLNLSENDAESSNSDLVSSYQKSKYSKKMQNKKILFSSSKSSLIQ